MLINYLQRVLDLVGEVLERADGDALLGRVLRRAVRLGHVGDHHLLGGRNLQDLRKIMVC